MTGFRLGISGAGETGRMLAEASIAAGIPAVIYDPSAEALEACVLGIRKRMFPGEYEPEVMDPAAISDLLGASGDPLSLMGAEIIIDATDAGMPEKTFALREILEVIPAGAIIAACLNPSSTGSQQYDQEELEKIIGIRLFQSPSGEKIAELIPGMKVMPANVKRLAAFFDTIMDGHITLGKGCYDGVVVPLALEIAREFISMQEEGITIEAVDTMSRLRLGMPYGISRMLGIYGKYLGQDNATWPGDEAQGHPGKEHYFQHSGKEIMYKANPSRLLCTAVNLAAGMIRTGALGLEEAENAMIQAFGWTSGLLSIADSLGIDSVVSILRKRSEITGDPRYITDPLLESMLSSGDTGESSGKGFLEHPISRSKIDNVELLVMGNHCLVTIEREKALNALDEGVWKGIRVALEQAAKDENIRTVFLTGSGRAFSAGDDIRMMGAWKGPDDAGRWMVEFARPLIDLLKHYSKPVVMLVNGIAYGGGCELTMLADIVVAAESAVFAMPEALIGAVPPIGSTYGLLWNRRLAKYLYTGDYFTAEEAKALGLVDIVVPGDQLWVVMKEIARKISRSAPTSAREIKRLANSGIAALEHLGREGENSLVNLSSSHDFHKGMREFLSKSKP